MFHLSSLYCTQASAVLRDHGSRALSGLFSVFQLLRLAAYGELTCPVSDPSHSRYGKHLSQAEVEDLVRPSSEALDLVHAWLGDHGISPERMRYSKAFDRMKLTLPVKDVEKLLRTKYSMWRHKDGTRILRTLEWSLPECLHQHISTIQPTNSFFRASPQKRMIMPVQSNMDMKSFANKPKVNAATMTVSEACNQTAITPDCLRVLYNTMNYTITAGDKNVIGIANYLGEYNNRSDTALFLQQFRTDATTQTFLNDFNVTALNGAIDQTTPNTAAQNANSTGIEGNLDLQYVVGISYPTKVRGYNTGGRPPFIPDLFTPTDTNEPYMNWVDYMLDLANPPQTISTSYGDSEQTVPESYARDVCNKFAQLGARGVTLLFSSGDAGVGGSGTCISNDGKNTTEFLPNFPASCPYITAVGGTKNFEPEVAAFDPRNNFTSGAGFSNYFARPSYQDDAVLNYTNALNGMYDGMYNASGRAYPDLAAQSQSFMVVWNQELQGVDGTSASCPTVAGIMGLVNDWLIGQDRPPMGFLNPWLYQRGKDAMNDVTSGSSAGCDGMGFPAMAGWDAVTGFGTPVSSRRLLWITSDELFRTSRR